MKGSRRPAAPPVFSPPPLGRRPEGWRVAGVPQAEQVPAVDAASRGPGPGSRAAAGAHLWLMMRCTVIHSGLMPKR